MTEFVWIENPPLDKALTHIPQGKYLNAVIFYLFLTYRSAKDPCSYWNRDPKNYIEC